MVVYGWAETDRKITVDNIFNTDKTSVFYKTAPGKTLKFKSEKCVDGKFSKERMTVAANMSGYWEIKNSTIF